MPTLPRFDHSAMDGYAVRTDDFSGTGPWSFEISGKTAAGDPPRGPVHAHRTAVEIYTGAPIPEGFDAVVIRERCARISGDRILTAFLPRTGENIRRRGEDVATGALVAASGSIVPPHVAALFAALGISEIDVRPRVRVALLTTGSELLRPGELLGPGQIYDSNRYMAAGMLSLPWIEFADLGRLPDDVESITASIGSASGQYDILLTSGGMSHGAADYVRAALAANGARLEVLNVAMRPGKPATIGRVGRALFIGLPGNPMAAAVVLQQIAFPAIRRTAGLARHQAEWFPAVAGFDYVKREGRTEFVPVKVAGRTEVGLPVLSALGRGSSGSLLPMAQADGLAMLPG